MAKQVVKLLIAVCYAAAASGADPDGVLVTGATGRTGSLIYLSLKKEHPSLKVRALVRSAAKAKEVLGCKLCDASEGIYIADVTNATALMEPTRGIKTVVIAVGVSGNGTTEKEARAVEFGGVENTIGALAQPANLQGCAVGYTQYCGLRVVLISSMGTTQPEGLASTGASILFFKLNAEAFLGGIGFPSAIVKPCGLLDTPGGKQSLLVGHDDTLFTNVSVPVMSRSDVAAVAREALFEEEEALHAEPLRFDLCAKPGPPTDPKAVLQAARYPWQAHTA
jgi:nucleoside-diphosphate-sugar epimerase